VRRDGQDEANRAQVNRRNSATQAYGRLASRLWGALVGVRAACSFPAPVRCYRPEPGWRRRLPVLRRVRQERSFSGTNVFLISSTLHSGLHVQRHLSLFLPSVKCKACSRQIPNGAVRIGASIPLDLYPSTTLPSTPILKGLFFLIIFHFPPLAGQQYDRDHSGYLWYHVGCFPVSAPLPPSGFASAMAGCCCG
jgi:hypothetical protein